MKINADLSGVEKKEADLDRETGPNWHVWEDGYYRVMVDSTDYKATNAGNGMCLHVKIVSLSGDTKGRFLMEFLTLEHPNAETVSISQIQLKSMAVAMGHPTPDFIDDSDELHSKPFYIRVYSKPSDRDFKDADGLEQKIGDYLTVQEYKDHIDSAPTKPAPTAKKAAPVPDDVPF